MLYRVALAVSVFAFVWATQVQAANIYHIGNSLTWDSQPTKIDALASSAGQPHDYGYHIRCNSSLTQIWADPTGTCVTPTSYGTFGPALVNNAWDAVTLQTFAGSGVTIGSEASAALNIINTARANLANSDTTFFVYSAWGLRHQLMTLWDDPVIDSNSTAVSYRREDSFLLYDRLAASTDANLGFIPVGDVFYALGHLIEDGDVTGYSSARDLYRDDIHASGLGSYAAQATTYASLYGNLDGITSASLGSTNSALVNYVVLDVINNFDFGAVRTVTVPEPSSLALLAVGLVGLVRRRHA